MLRGHFIVLEGLDGAGTTTQSEALRQALVERGHPTIHTAQPSDGWIGKEIRRCLRGEHTVDAHSLALLFAADRIDHLTRVVEPALARGWVVLCDRYLLSSWVYQGLSCDLEWIQAINARAPWPDLTLVVEVTPQVAASRVGRRSASGGPAPERFEAQDLQVELAARYKEMARLPGQPNVVFVDGEPSRSEVTQSLLAHCIERLGL